MAAGSSGCTAGCLLERLGIFYIAYGSLTMGHFATRVRQAGNGERYCAQPFALPRLPEVSLSIHARHCREATTGIRPRPARGRIDGPAKVTGSKLYASDFRAADLPGWPPNTSHALLIRATDATHVFTGVDLSRLSGALKPSRVVTAADLAGAGIRVPAFFEGDLFCPGRAKRRSISASRWSC